jgi:hypothetical protein
MSSFDIHWPFAILALTILVTGTSLAVVCLYLVLHIRSRARRILVIVIAVTYLAAVAYSLANTTIALVTENFDLSHTTERR